MTKGTSQLDVREVAIPVGGAQLKGGLTLPTGALGLVIFAHGSGSGRHSPRNQSVARTLQNDGLGTLLFDLLTEEEEQAEYHTRHLRFDIPLLADRLVAVTRWIAGEKGTDHLPISYFGASTGAAAALVAAAQLGEKIHAVVSRGGRPDLAGKALVKVVTPTLLIVGERDVPVIKLNQEAAEQLGGKKVLTIVPGATHLFEEPGTLEQVAILASAWFLKHVHPIPVV
jgi:pimeloyl-ACP methyl ester carboxylesterase